ncbi:HesA/MoeB/ThiF family protein [Streptomyces sp. NPDC050418]|uniref:HesA/MoeB/ThiF family protein n=1 Tax=Streptomyces sp. NPDC050418 TaxID=3365612 RepID=UPI00378B8D80
MKPEHRAYRTSDGHVRIGSVIYGIGAEIPDPDGWVWPLIEAMDGTAPLPAILATVSEAHPGVPAEDLREAVADLLAAGYIEDASAAIPPEFTERERIRYSRSVPLHRWMDLTPRETAWDTQLRLRNARVLLLGLGGTGGFAAQTLVASGIGRLHCVEPDVVELSNLNRQPLFVETDIGQPKLDAALDALRARNNDAVITGERREVRTSGDLAELLSPGYDLLLLAADRPPAIRRWANRACLATNTPWVDAGYHGPLVTVGVHVPGVGACWECHRAGEVERRDLRVGPGQDEDVASPRFDWNPANAVTASLSGTLQTHAALALLTGVPAMEPGFRFGINLMVPGDPVLERFDRRPDCPACGKAHD